MATTANSITDVRALEIHVITLDNAGRTEIRVIDAATGQRMMTVPGVPAGPDGLGRAEAKIRQLLPLAEAYTWADPWSYAPTRREVRNVKRLWPAREG